MTLQNLHEIPKFVELFSDHRFVAAMIYMREHPEALQNNHIDATMIIRNEGQWKGWFGFARELEALSKPPVQTAPLERVRPYQPPPSAQKP
jgi:hypothetical protein